MASAPRFGFDDLGTFNQNLNSFSDCLRQLDTVLGYSLASALPALADGTQDKAKLLRNLLTVLVTPAGTGAAVTSPAPVAAAASSGAPAQAVAASSPPPRWFLEQVEIEGLRGINNEGSPLLLKFKANCVNSVSAPNGVGKSSIYEALSFALTGGIAKLDKLLQAERGQDYYLNRFHPADIGTVKLTLRLDTGGKAIAITVTRSASGARTVKGPPGFDANALLAELNREFVLLDARTFQEFIDVKALDRGRSFSGLLGLARYSSLRQELQALANTRAFNTHFDVSGHAATKTAAERAIRTAKTAITSDFASLVKEALDPAMKPDDAQARCLAALSGIPVLTNHCVGKLFMNLDIDACIDAVKLAEGGPKRVRLGEVIREQDVWSKADKVLPTEDDLPLLAPLATAREEALRATAGELLNELYRISEKVISADTWPSPTLCPTCDRDDGSSVLDIVRAKLGQYDAVDAATVAVGAEWTTKGWAEPADLEALTLEANEAPLLKQLSKAGEAGTLSTAEAEELAAYVSKMRDRAKAHVAGLNAERAALEKELPPSLVTVTTAVETARRLQTSWESLARAEATAKAEDDRATHVSRIKKFFDDACSIYARAESDMAAERLRKVQPLCQSLFKDIMISPVVPALEKPEGSEELAIRLAEFWSLRNVSAQALLSESFRNGFAVSVYLAAASLYGGSPRFMIFDDVTSSFDAGHQHHLVEVIRTRFARPLNPDGPQVIMLSHDTLLEKLFNKHSSSTEWSHQRLEGTARTAVLPQSGAVKSARCHDRFAERRPN